jgi:phage shock protein PspC (stress-responsive transcriptional regulator)
MQDAVQTPTISLPMRGHTIFGVCEAIGEDFGFNPTYLRVPLAAMVLVSIKYAVLAYFVLGAVVLTSRLLFPQAKPAEAAAAETLPAPVVERLEEPQPLPIAA